MCEKTQHKAIREGIYNIQENESSENSCMAYSFHNFFFLKMFSLKSSFGSDAVVQKREEEKQGEKKHGRDGRWLLEYWINSRVERLGGGPDVGGQKANTISFWILGPPMPEVVMSSDHQKSKTEVTGSGILPCSFLFQKRVWNSWKRL